MDHITRCLNKQLIGICQHSILLDNLTLKLSRYLPTSLIKKVRVGSFDKGYLSIITDHAWATELRCWLPMLRDKLRTEAGLYQLIAIKIQIVSDL